MVREKNRKKQEKIRVNFVCDFALFSEKNKIREFCISQGYKKEGLKHNSYIYDFTSNFSHFFLGSVQKHKNFVNLFHNWLIRSHEKLSWRRIKERIFSWPIVTAIVIQTQLCRSLLDEYRGYFNVFDWLGLAEVIHKIVHGDNIESAQVPFLRNGSQNDKKTAKQKRKENKSLET